MVCVSVVSVFPLLRLLRGMSRRPDLIWSNMVWPLRAAVVLLGVIAWCLSYVLAFIGLGEARPPWLLSSIIGFGAAYATISVGSLVWEYRRKRRQDIRELQRDAYDLARDLRALIAEAYAAMEATASELSSEHEEEIARAIARGTCQNS